MTTITYYNAVRTVNMRLKHCNYATSVETLFTTTTATELHQNSSQTVDDDDDDLTLN